MKKFVIKYKVIYILIALILAFIMLNFIKMNTSSVSVQHVEDKGEQYIKSGRIALAIEHYYNQTLVYPNNVKLQLKLGSLYEELNAFDKAKIAYFRALNINPKCIEAKFALVNLYTSQKSYELALKMLKPYEHSSNKKILEKFGDFYYIWGSNIVDDNISGAIRKYKRACGYYKKSSKLKSDFIKRQVYDCYIGLANKLVIEEDYAEALRVLKISLRFDNNAEAHYKIAEIYGTAYLDKAILEYKKGFELYHDDTKVDNYVVLLVEKARILEESGNSSSANYYIQLAKKFKPDKKIDFNYTKNILVNVFSTKYNEDYDRDTLLPGISFKIINMSKEPLPYLATKVVFYDNGKLVGEEQEVIATQDFPMEADTVSPIINIYSPEEIRGLSHPHKINIHIYMAQEFNNWKLYRKTDLYKKNNSIR